MSLEARSLDWPRFISLLDCHMIGSLALTRLQRLAPGLLPAAIAKQLTSEHLQDTARHALHLRETLSVVALLTSKGIDSLVLKGVSVANLLYRDAPECRTTSDIDILVGEDEFDVANTVLVAAGYERTLPQVYPSPPARAMHFYLENVVAYSSPGHHQTIELHRRLSANPYVFPETFAGLRAAASSASTPEGEVLGLDGATLQEYLAWHAATAVDCRLKWFADAERVRNRSVGATKMVNTHAVALTDAVIAELGKLFGGGVSPISSSDRWIVPARRIVDDMRICRVTDPGRTLKRIPREIGYTWLHARLAATLLGKAHTGLRFLADPRDAEQFRLGPSFALLYALAGPVLAAVRRVRRVRGARP